MTLAPLATADWLQTLLQLQPNAVVFNGCASGGIARPSTCITRSPTQGATDRGFRGLT